MCFFLFSDHLAQIIIGEWIVSGLQMCFYFSDHLVEITIARTNHSCNQSLSNDCNHSNANALQYFSMAAFVT